MSEPSVERLSRFTPDPGGLDRDALLFAAGRASARPNRALVALAGVLAVTQALTLALLLWPHPTPPPGPPSAPRPTVMPVPDSPESPGLWSVHHDLTESEFEKEPAPYGGSLIESGPPLRAFGPTPSSILN
jgi:hypothetical protein